MAQNIIERINTSEVLDFNESFDIYKSCSSLLINNDHLGRRVLINILSNRHKFHRNLNNILADLIEAAGFYPYLKKEQLNVPSTSSKIRTEFHHSSHLKDKYLHEDQKTLSNLLKTKINTVVSAPTSFGKSVLIEELIASYKYKNIVIIQPTLALLDETRKKLMKYQEHYKLIVRTSQEPATDKGNIFLLTAERVCEYSNFPPIEYLIIDEFYKLSAKRDDERSDSLNNAFYKIQNNYNCPFYLLGPNIDEISPRFEEKYNAIFYKTNYTLVDCESINIFKDYTEQFGERGHKKLFKEDKLFELLYSLKEEQSIIYCSSPNRVRYLSGQFCEYLRALGITPENKLPIIEWINSNIGNLWSLIGLLQFGIGIHDGALQKHITSSIIDYFNKNKLKYLFCTTTIIEGVNTSAKNIIFFDKYKGTRKPIDFFDYSNIKGRAGRMMVHYVGRIFNFNPPPHDNKVIIDIPFFYQSPISDEILIHIADKDVKNRDSEQYRKLMSIPEIERTVYKENGVRVEGQKNIVEILRRDLPSHHDLVNWQFKPSYRQLSYIITLGWNNLLHQSETTKPLTLNKLIKLTFDYSYNQSIDFITNNNFSYRRNLQKNIDKSDNQLFDEAVLESFQVLKHWFQYKIPKWLSVINKLQRFVCAEKGIAPGNYSYFANLVENDFLRENLSILSEYGIPSSAIRKLEELIPSNINQDNVLDFVKKENLISSTTFIEYEIEKIKENL